MQIISDIFLELLDHRVCIFQYQSSFFTSPLIFLIHDMDILLTTKPVSFVFFIIHDSFVNLIQWKFCADH